MAKHMTQDDRKVLEARYNAGQSVAGIARAMSFNYSTIYKELKRGDTGKMDANGRAGYSAELGQKRLYNAAAQVSGGFPGGVRHGRSVQAEPLLQCGLPASNGTVPG